MVEAEAEAEDERLDSAKREDAARFLRAQLLMQDGVASHPQLIAESTRGSTSITRAR